jgi:phosphate transport system permease protein
MAKAETGISQQAEKSVSMTEIANVSPVEPGFTRSRSLHNTTSRIINRVMMIGCYAAALLTITALFVIFGYILYRGFTSLSFALFTQLPGPADGSRPIGMRNCIAGTLVLIAMASCVGVPLGMLCGIYLAEYAGDNWFSHFVRLVVDVLAGVPSIVVGVLAYEMVVAGWTPVEYGSSGPMNALIAVINGFVSVRNYLLPNGFSAWAGAVALGFMMCPIIARTTEEMLKLVPKALREASVGLGGSKFQTLTRVVIPAASAGIITGIMLAVARVAGETAPLLFTVLGSDQPVFTFNGTFPFMHADLGHAFPSLTIQIFKYATSAEPVWNQQAWAGMLILIVMVLVLNICVRVASSRKHYKM